MIAKHILTAHNAAELAIAAIAEHASADVKERAALMDYFPAIKQKCHSEKEVEGKDYFSQLNTVRKNLKHSGIYPDPKQWARVTENTYSYISAWFVKYLDITYDQLDESALIRDPRIKENYIKAEELIRRGKYSDSLEVIATSEWLLFEIIGVVGSISVGKARAEDAIKLSAYGVHANEYLTLQEFLPEVVRDKDGEIKIVKHQKENDHPANWTEENAKFCLRTFLALTLRIQDAEWIPSVVSFDVVYEYELTVINDNADWWNWEAADSPAGWVGKEKKKKTIRKLMKGEKLRGFVFKEKKEHGFGALLAKSEFNEKIISVYDTASETFGFLEKDQVSIKCVPRKTDYVNKYYSDLPIIDAELE